MSLGKLWHHDPRRIAHFRIEQLLIGDVVDIGGVRVERVNHLKFMLRCGLMTQSFGHDSARVTGRRWRQVLAEVLTAVFDMQGFVDDSSAATHVHHIEESGVLDKLRRGDSGWVYIGRHSPRHAFPHSPYANPFQISKQQPRSLVLARFQQYILEHPKCAELIAALAAERDANGELHLVCFCHPEPCHGDILAALVDGRPLPMNPELPRHLEKLGATS